MTPERASGPCVYSAAQVDTLLQDRDRIWCLSLLSAVPALGTVKIEGVLKKYHDLLSRETEVLEALRLMARENSRALCGPESGEQP